MGGYSNLLRWLVGTALSWLTLAKCMPAVLSSGSGMKMPPVHASRVWRKDAASEMSGCWAPALRVWGMCEEGGLGTRPACVGHV